MPGPYRTPSCPRLPAERLDRFLDRLVGPSILLSALLLLAGWNLPIMSVRRFFLLGEEVSVLGGAMKLWESGHPWLFLLLLLFSLVFPAGKLAVALVAWLGGAGSARTQRLLAWSDRLGRWSMLDVFLVALVVLAAESSLIADVEAEPGIYLFAAAILLSIFAISRLKRRVRPGPGKPLAD